MAEILLETRNYELTAQRRLWSENCSHNPVVARVQLCWVRSPTFRPGRRILKSK